MKNINLIFNFIGVAVVDWQPAFQFFTQTLGMKYQLESRYGDWAMLGGGWDAYYKDGSRSAIFELFDGGQAVTERYWGLNQGIRPGFHVSNLQPIVDRLDIPFTLAKRPWGNTAEFISTEGIRFAFAEIPGTPFSDDLSVPYIGHAAIKCANFELMQHFYEDVLGLIRVDAAAEYALFSQPDDHPFIVLEPGGSPSAIHQHDNSEINDAVRASPVFMSLMTTDVQAAYIYLQHKAVTVLRETMSHEDWGGTDFHIADPDGNRIQVVQYG
ncbi:MAG TPA: VOC family protein [Anaerolineales bacterium]|nr:VOC family protein [Anaerolineales bacterium]